MSKLSKAMLKQGKTAIRGTLHKVANGWFLKPYNIKGACDLCVSDVPKNTASGVQAVVVFSGDGNFAVFDRAEPVLPLNALRALRKVLDYIDCSEAEDYDGTLPKDRRNHVYHHAQTVHRAMKVL